MPIQFHPRPGQILMCNFDGFIEPEMVKKRPVLVVSAIKTRADLVTVVALSTTPPEPIQNYHMAINRNSMPQTGFFQESDTWVKGDMVYTLCFQRLDLIVLGKRRSDGKRQYHTQRLGRDVMRSVYGCILNGLGIGGVATHL